MNLLQVIKWNNINIIWLIILKKNNPKIKNWNAIMDNFEHPPTQQSRLLEPKLQYFCYNVLDPLPS